jgi:hypothetical protein
MKQTVNNSQFHTAFHNMDRGSQFSYQALNLIYDYLEEFESSTGEDVELDVIAICCEYSEMTHQEVADSYDIELEDGEELDEAVLSYLNKHTSVIGETDDTVVFVQF